MRLFLLLCKIYEKRGQVQKNRIFAPLKNRTLYLADVAKLVDAPDLGSGAARHGGSSPFIRTFLNLIVF